MLAAFITNLKKVHWDESTHSPAYAKVVSTPFLVSAWLVGTLYGGRLVWDNKNPDDLIWSLAGVALTLYAAYKTGNVIVHRAKNGQVTMEQVGQPGQGSPAPEAPAPEDAA